jgi:hypothetical protein
MLRLRNVVRFVLTLVRSVCCSVAFFLRAPQYCLFRVASRVARCVLLLCAVLLLIRAFVLAALVICC